jgi:hypothetical protein
MFGSVYRLGKQEEKKRGKRVSPIVTVLRMYASLLLLPPFFFFFFSLSLSLSLSLSVAMDYGLNET